MPSVKSKDSLSGRVELVRNGFSERFNKNRAPSAPYLYVAEVFDDHVIFEQAGGYQRLGYTMTDGAVAFSSKPEPVSVRVSYESVAKASWTAEIAKADKAQQNVFGWAYRVTDDDGKLKIDKQGDFWLPDELEKTAYSYMLSSGKSDVMHQEIAKGRIVESMVFTPEKVSKMGLPDTTPLGWWCGIHVDDKKTWEGVESGLWKMFSVGGRGVRRKVTVNAD